MLLIDVARQGQGITWAHEASSRETSAMETLLRAGSEDWDIEVGICLFRSRARMTRAAEASWSGVQKVPAGKNARPQVQRPR